MKKDQPFKIESSYKPMGDQPNAIETLVDGLNEGLCNNAAFL